MNIALLRQMTITSLNKTSDSEPAHLERNHLNHGICSGSSSTGRLDRIFPTSKVLTAMTMKCTIFRDVTPRRRMEVHGRFGGTYCFLLQR
jgi:hypothetical protein